uniref:Uncharacterized protein n=1 Tax=Pan paniscus TaxID=9597 RepID=A0A2R9BE77_PANPA
MPHPYSRNENNGGRGAEDSSMQLTTRRQKAEAGVLENLAVLEFTLTPPRSSAAEPSSPALPAARWRWFCCQLGETELGHARWRRPPCCVPSPGCWPPPGSRAALQCDQSSTCESRRMPNLTG